MAAIIIGGVFALAFFGVAIIVGIIYGRNKNQHRSPGNPEHPFGIPMSNKKIPWTGRRFLGDDDSGRRKR